jgi:hypothetical protein
MQALLNDPDTKFDAVMVIPFFGNEAGYYLAHRFKAPLILYFTGQVREFIFFGLGSESFGFWLFIINIPRAVRRDQLIWHCITFRHFVYPHFVHRHRIVCRTHNIGPQVSLSWVDDAIGQPHNTAYLPVPVLPFTSDMNFLQRTVNTLGTFVFHKILRNFYILVRISVISVSGEKFRINFIL